VLALPSPSAHRSPSYHVTNHTRTLNMRVTACTSLHDLGHSGSIVVGIEMSANPGAHIDQQHPYETTELCTEKISLTGTCCIRRPNRVEELCREHCVASTSAFPCSVKNGLIWVHFSGSESAPAYHLTLYCRKGYLSSKPMIWWLRYSYTMHPSCEARKSFDSLLHRPCVLHRLPSFDPKILARWLKIL
jgi:hypothetical protein